MIRQLVQVRPAHPEVANDVPLPSAQGMGDPQCGVASDVDGRFWLFDEGCCGRTICLPEEKKRRSSVQI